MLLLYALHDVQVDMEMADSDREDRDDKEETEKEQSPPTQVSIATICVHVSKIHVI